jgi:hypothetical protein
VTLEYLTAIIPCFHRVLASLIYESISKVDNRQLREDKSLEPALKLKFVSLRKLGSKVFDDGPRRRRLWRDRKPGPKFRAGVLPVTIDAGLSR